jgi:peptide deformylase
MILTNVKKLKVLQCTDPRLREVSEPIKEFDKTLNDFAKYLGKMMLDPLGHGVETVGISAVQVGLKVRLCICRDPKSGKAMAMVNPEVVSASSTLSKELEGCISVGEGMKQLFAYVPRPNMVTIKFYDLKGQEGLLDAKGLLSHIVQHEIDHMNGKLFIDYFDDPSDIMTLAELNEREADHTLAI